MRQTRITGFNEINYKWLTTQMVKDYITENGWSFYHIRTAFEVWVHPTLRSLDVHVNPTTKKHIELLCTVLRIVMHELNQTPGHFNSFAKKWKKNNPKWKSSASAKDAQPVIDLSSPNVAVGEHNIVVTQEELPLSNEGDDAYHFDWLRYSSVTAHMVREYMLSKQFSPGSALEFVELYNSISEFDNNCLYEPKIVKALENFSRTAKLLPREFDEWLSIWCPRNDEKYPASMLTYHPVHFHPVSEPIKWERITGIVCPSDNESLINDSSPASVSPVSEAVPVEAHVTYNDDNITINIVINLKRGKDVQS